MKPIARIGLLLLAFFFSATIFFSSSHAQLIPFPDEKIIPFDNESDQGTPVQVAPFDENGKGTVVVQRSNVAPFDNTGGVAVVQQREGVAPPPPPEPDLDDDYELAPPPPPEFDDEDGVAVEQISEDEMRLQILANNLLPLFDNMPPVPVYIRPAASEATFLKNPNAAAFHSTAGRIVFKQEYYEANKENLQELGLLMKHELTHAWMHWKGYDPNDSTKHGPIFNRKLAAVENLAFNVGNIPPPSEKLEDEADSIPTIVGVILAALGGLAFWGLLFVIVHVVFSKAGPFILAALFFGFAFYPNRMFGSLLFEGEHVIAMVLGGICLIWGFSRVYGKGSSDPVMAAGELYGAHNINQPWLVSRMQVGRYDKSAEAAQAKRGAIVAATALHQAQNQSAITIMQGRNELEQTPARIARKNELEALSHQTALQTTYNRQMIIQKANSSGLSLEAYNQREINNIEAEREERLARIRIEEETSRAHIELTKRWMMIQQNLASGFMYAEREFDYLDMHWNYLDSLHTRRKQLIAERAPLRQRRLLDQHISDMEAKYLERSRLLSHDAQQNTGGSYTNSYSRGSAGTTGAGTSLEIPGTPPWEESGEEPVS
jgi:hypothetical protein